MGSCCSTKTLTNSAPELTEKEAWRLTKGRWDELEGNAEEIFQDYSNEVKRVLKEQSAEKAFGIRLNLDEYDAGLKELEELTETLQLLTESNVVYIRLGFMCENRI